MKKKEKKMILCVPHGFCAGVDRAVKMVELALEAYGTPLYVHHEIVHNEVVVNGLREKGVVFVNSIDDVPGNSRLIFSAHGVPPGVRRQAEELNLKTLDATCPLVTKVHLEAIRYAKKGYHIFLIGHKKHVEVQGTYGEAPESITIVEPANENSLKKNIARLTIPENHQLIYLTQTTLSVHDCNRVVQALKNRFPALTAPPKDDICYATTNRQNAVKATCSKVDFFVVIGSENSSNSRRLVEVALNEGVAAELFQNVEQLASRDWTSIVRIGVTAGASTPAVVINQIINFLQELGFDRESDMIYAEEKKMFSIPRDLVKDLGKRKMVV
ncbi:MAG: 4-hydroxy-3-methylbut-2-enyl diphosphate reductase [Acidobacteria bacterium]|nr:MAG: 4-hydroxy-3-methylbut-2-enyl diphosphate reductase [Acidobacteriota bacterium]